jgi:hypothetical protein
MQKIIKIPVGKLDKKRRLLGIVFCFRILLWWSSIIIRSVFDIKKDSYWEQKISNSGDIFPASSWFFKKQEGYCMIFDQCSRKVGIYLIPKIEIN